MSKYESLAVEGFEVSGYAGEMKKTYAPNRIDRDGRAFGCHLKNCEISLTDPNGKVWRSQVEVASGGGYWTGTSTSFDWHSVEVADDTVVLRGDAVILSQTYNARDGFGGGWSNTRQRKPIEVVLR